MTNTNEIEAAIKRLQETADHCGKATDMIRFTSRSSREHAADLRTLIAAASGQSASPSTSDNPPPMSREEIERWIMVCNHQPAKQVLRDYLRLSLLDRTDGEEARSLLRPATSSAPAGCHCPPDKCWAPVVLGQQMPCRRASPLTAPATREDGMREVSVNVEDVIVAEWQTIVEMDDRTSPAEYPDMALITRDELADAMYAAHSSGRLAGLEEAAGVAREELENRSAEQKRDLFDNFLRGQINAALRITETIETLSKDPTHGHQ